MTWYMYTSVTVVTYTRVASKSFCKPCSTFIEIWVRMAVADSEGGLCPLFCPNFSKIIVKLKIWDLKWLKILANSGVLPPPFSKFLDPPLNRSSVLLVCRKRWLYGTIFCVLLRSLNFTALYRQWVKKSLSER
jgi:hypothetical protein